MNKQGVALMGDARPKRLIEAAQPGQDVAAREQRLDGSTHGHETSVIREQLHLANGHRRGGGQKHDEVSHDDGR